MRDEGSFQVSARTDERSGGVRVVLDERLPHGHAVALTLPSPDAGYSSEDLEHLHAGERAFAAGLAPRRRHTWIGGRLALRAALGRIGIACGAILSTARGAPALTTGIAGSVSHKDRFAVALADLTGEWRIGVDYEPLVPPRERIERKVLTPEERKDWLLLPEDTRWEYTLRRFSIKEAVYKAIDPFLGRFVGFDEVTVAPGASGEVDVRPLFETRLRIEARWTPLCGGLLATARARE